MKYFDTFTGYGGFTLGIQRAFGNNRESRPAPDGETSASGYLPDLESGNEKGRQRATCIGYSEVNKYAIQVYEKHFPEHKPYGDITQINPSSIPDFDLLTGGFPCQAFSIAGKRQGFNDTRGTLFFDIARILKEKRPRNFILENVKGLLSHDNGRTFKTIITTLTELGYCVEWQVLNAKDFGVPQNRERVFIVGHFGGIPERKVFPIGASNEINLKQDEQGDEVAYCLQAGGDKHRGSYIVHNVYGGFGEEGVREFRDIAPTIRTPQGGGHIPMVVEVEKHCETCVCSKTDKVINENPEDVDAHCETCCCDMKIRRLTPKECERLMGLPDDWTEGQSDTQRYKLCGNGVVVNVVEAIVRKLYGL